MNLSDIKNRVDELSSSSEYQQPARDDLAFQQYSSVLSIMVAFYGEGSSQLKSFIRDKDTLFEKYGARATEQMSYLAIGTLKNLKHEVDSGFTGNLEQSISGEVLTDFVALGRRVLDGDRTDESKNVASVLAAAAFEDTLRRLAKNNNIPHIPSLADLLNELKNQRILQGTQVGIANSYLNFRNSALHAQWDRIDRASVSSVLGFVEQLLLVNF
jgi:hypothetical protein